VRPGVGGHVAASHDTACERSADVRTAGPDGVGGARPPCRGPVALPTVRKVGLNVVKGFFMGASDVVPGVSGGTVALVFGIYHRLVSSIQSGSSALGALLRGDVQRALARLRSVEWTFLVSLLAGIGLAVLTLSHLIETLLEDRPVEMAGLFLGLVGGSIVIAWELLRNRDAVRWAVLVVTGVVVFVLLGLSGGTTEDSVSQISDPAWWAFLGAGAIAICAMILPGISGSFLLVVMGMYASVLGAVNDREIASVLLFMLGCVIGLGLFSQVLHWALNRHYDTVMAGLIGLMVGSLRVLWPWPQGVDSTVIESPTDPVLVPVLLALAGFVVVVFVGRVTREVEHRTAEDDVADLQAS
jgi:putative membrane protein